MTTIFVQLSDESENSIISVFGCQQDSSAYPNQGKVETTDTRYLDYLSAMPPFAQSGLPV